jgi:catechol 2,3-dioxygenase-like lactoylglutathione lyase family enzyme
VPEEVKRELAMKIDHLGIIVSESDKSILFYEHCLAPLGIKVLQRQPEIGAVLFAGEDWLPFLFIGQATGDYHGTEVRVPGYRPMHLALAAPSRAAVDEFHRAGLAHGGRDNGAPEAGEGFYSAFLLDPDGNNIEAILRE